MKGKYHQTPVRKTEKAKTENKQALQTKPTPQTKPVVSGVNLFKNNSSQQQPTKLLSSPTPIAFQPFSVCEGKLNLEEISKKKPSLVISVFHKERQETLLDQLKKMMKSEKYTSQVVCITCPDNNWENMRYLSQRSHMLIWLIEAYELATQLLMAKMESKAHPLTYIIGAEGIDPFYPSPQSKFRFLLIENACKALAELKDFSTQTDKPVISQQTFNEFLHKRKGKKKKDTDSDLLNFYVPMYHVTLANNAQDKKTQLTLKIYVPGIKPGLKLDYELFKSEDLIYFLITGDKKVEGTFLESTRFSGRFKLRLSFLKETFTYYTKLPVKPVADPLIDNGIIHLAYEFN